MRLRLKVVLALSFATICFPILAAEKPVDADLLLKGGTILDGTGKPGTPGDVAIRGERIVGVGEFQHGKIGRVIDCTGLVVTPGYIDLHNHSDNPILKPKTRSGLNYLTQGCTTIVTGNCGGGQVKVGEFLKKLDENGTGVNIVHLIPHGAVRASVMGREKRAPTEQELKKMLALTEQGMKDGAWGMSTGLIYVPGVFAETDEIVALAKLVTKHRGIYASHIRGESETLLDAVEEALLIGRQANVPVHISHFKCNGKPFWGTVRIAAKRIEQARQAGQQATADQYPYTASSTSLAAMVLPAWAREGGNKAVVRRMKDAKQLPKLRKEIAKSLEVRDRMQVASYKPNPKWTGKLLTEIAKEENRDPVDIAVEILTSGGASAVNFGMSESDVRHVMQLPWVATASDGAVKIDDGTKPHPRSYGTFPRRLGHYAIAEKVISLEHAIRSSSGLPADILGMKDRGYLRAGYVADVVVFDPKTLRDKATFQEPFLHSTGIRWVFLRGKAAIADGKPSEELYGRALRK